jgi:hypothetical protein
MKQIGTQVMEISGYPLDFQQGWDSLVALCTLKWYCVENAVRRLGVGEDESWYNIKSEGKKRGLKIFFLGDYLLLTSFFIFLSLFAVAPQSWETSQTWESTSPGWPLYPRGATTHPVPTLLCPSCVCRGAASVMAMLTAAPPSLETLQAPPLLCRW